MFPISSFNFLKSLAIFSLIILALSSCQKEEGNSFLGAIVHKEFSSKFIGKRNIDIWLPPNFSDQKQYAVLYMQDGQMLFDSSKTWNKQEWGMDEVLLELLKGNKIRESIIVGISNAGPNRRAEYLPQKAFEALSPEQQKMFSDTSEVFSADHYLQFLVEELIPYIQQHYPTETGPNNTFIGGSSMGALISLYALTEYPDQFGGAACLSSHWPGIIKSELDYTPLSQAMITYFAEHIPKAGNHKIYFDYGTEGLDALYEPAQLKIDSLMVEKEYTSLDWKTLKFPGADHSERDWNKRLKIPLQFLLAKEAIPSQEDSE